MDNKEYIKVRLPRKIVEKVKKIVEAQDGLFEDEEDYITHCIRDYNRRLKYL